MSTIYLPAGSADQWAQFLAEPVKHWRTGFSARTLAYSWQEAAGFPSEVARVLRASDRLRGIELLLAIPEHQVPLPGGSRPSQNDIWALASSEAGLVSIAVEGKVEEPFGPTVSEWLAEASTGKTTRLTFLQDLLSLPGALPSGIRYQLLHRAASALIEAKRFHATQAILLVHSFSPAATWFSDYEAFASLLGVRAQANRVHSAGTRGGVEFHIAWVSGDAAYLAR